jgi:hypothetical protein
MRPPAVDLSKPVPRELCWHIAHADANVGMGGKSPRRCIRCGKVEWVKRGERMKGERS